MNQPIVSTLSPHNEGDRYQQLLNSVAALPAEEGIRQIKSFLQTYPSFATAHNDLGVLYLQAGNPTLALAHYEKAARLQPDNTTFKKNLADFYAVELGWYDDAVDMYLDILKKNPRDTEALVALGQLGNAMQAATELPVPEVKPALEQSYQPHISPAAIIQHKPATEPIQPPTPQQLHNSAAELIQQGKNREALSILQQLLAYHPKYAVAHNDLAILLQQEGNITEAKKHHEKALQLQPDNLTFKKNLADFLYLACDDPESALQHYVDILRHSPKDVDTLTALSRICIENNQTEDAKTFLRSILSVEPWNQEARQALSTLNQNDKKTFQADQNRKTTAEEMHAKAAQHAKEERHHEAHSILEELVHLYPDFAPGHNDLGVIRYRLGDINGSHRAYQQAVELQPTSLNFRKNLADLCFTELDKVDEAINIYLDLHKKYPRDVETLINLGHISNYVGHPEEGKKFFRRALEIEPWNREAREALKS